MGQPAKGKCQVFCEIRLAPGDRDPNVDYTWPTIVQPERYVSKFFLKKHKTCHINLFHFLSGMLISYVFIIVFQKECRIKFFPIICPNIILGFQHDVMSSYCVIILLVMFRLL